MELCSKIEYFKDTLKTKKKSPKISTNKIGFVYLNATGKGTFSKEGEFVSGIRFLPYTTQQLGGQQVVLICKFGTNWARGKNLGRFDKNQLWFWANRK